MHLVQISFSVCFTVSFYLWEKAQLEFIGLIKALGKIIYDTEKYNEIVHSTKIRSNSHKSLLFPLPFMLISSIYFYFGIYPNLPDRFFPIVSSFHYLAILFSFFMLYLLGSKGFWYLYTLAQLYKHVSLKYTLPLFVLFKQPFRFFSIFPFRVSLYLFIIEVTVLPILIYIVSYYNIKAGLCVTIFGALGLFLAVSFVVYLFSLMNRSIHIFILKSKDERLNEVISKLEECEKEIDNMKKSPLMNNKNNDLTKLLRYHAYLDSVRREVMDIPEKTPKSLRFFELLVSILPSALLVQFINPAIEQIISLV